MWIFAIFLSSLIIETKSIVIHLKRNRKNRKPKHRSKEFRIDRQRTNATPDDRSTRADWMLHTNRTMIVDDQMRTTLLFVSRNIRYPMEWLSDVFYPTKKPLFCQPTLGPETRSTARPRGGLVRGGVKWNFKSILIASLSSSFVLVYLIKRYFTVTPNNKKPHAVSRIF